MNLVTAQPTDKRDRRFGGNEDGQERNGSSGKGGARRAHANVVVFLLPTLPGVSNSPAIVHSACRGLLCTWRRKGIGNTE